MGSGGLALVLIFSLAFVFGFVRPFVVEVLFIASESMSPTLRAGDRVLVSKSSYRFGGPDRGDIAVFERGEGVAMKRIVGLPGDVVEIRDGVLFVNGERKREPYVDYRLTDSSFFGPERVPPGRVFVMGDNRPNSLDSRSFGTIPRDDLAGKAVFRFRAF